MTNWYEPGEDIANWLRTASLCSAEVDCITAVMLKILDGKCKMPADEKQRMTALYAQAKSLQGKYLGAFYHQLIAQAHTSLTEALVTRIYEARVLAETQISRPVMKRFKARLRREGILSDQSDQTLAAR